jgi:hypothetical protein
MTSRRTAMLPFARRLLACALAAGAALVPAVPLAAEEEHHPIIQEAVDDYWRGDFAALDKRYRELQRETPFLEDGASKLEYFRVGLKRVAQANVSQAEPYLRELEALTLQWASEYPKSALAHIMHARVLTVHAWSHRGGGYADSVTPERMEQFHAYLRRAATYLKDHADVALTDSSAHAELLEIGRGLGWNKAEIEAISEAGLKLAPHDVELVFDTLYAYLPKWGGSARQLDGYIRRATERTKADYGTGMYARLYSIAADSQYGQALFENSHADWPKMKRAYEDMHARFPNSPTRRNRFAYMACVARDRSTLLALLAELGTKVDAKHWGADGARTLEGCQRWAKET